MLTLTNTLEQLTKALTITENNTDVLSYHDERDIKRALNAAIDALRILNKPPQVYVPHLNEFIEDKQFYIWYNADRTTETFSVAITNWTEEFARSVLDMLVWEKNQHKNGQKAEGASIENDVLIGQAAELVLSKFEYIKATVVI